MLLALEWVAILNWAVGVIILVHLRINASGEDDARGLWPYLVSVLAIIFWPIPAFIYLSYKAISRLLGR